MGDGIGVGRQIKIVIESTESGWNFVINTYEEIRWLKYCEWLG